MEHVDEFYYAFTDKNVSFLSCWSDQILCLLYTFCLFCKPNRLFKVGLSPSKRNCFICVNESPLK